MKKLLCIIVLMSGSILHSASFVRGVGNVVGTSFLVYTGAHAAVIGSNVYAITKEQQADPNCYYHEDFLKTVEVGSELLLRLHKDKNITEMQRNQLIADFLGKRYHTAHGQAILGILATTMLYTQFGAGIIAGSILAATAHGHANKTSKRTHQPYALENLAYKFTGIYGKGSLSKIESNFNEFKDIK